MTRTETPAAQAKRLIQYRAKAEAELVASPKDEVWPIVLEMLEFVEKTSAAFSIASDFTIATREYLVHEILRNVKTGAALPTPTGDFSTCMRRQYELQAQLTGVAQPSEGIFRARSERLVKELEAAKVANRKYHNDNASLARMVSSAHVEGLRQEKVEAVEKAREAEAAKKVIERKNEKLTEKIAELEEELTSCITEEDACELQEANDTLQSKLDALRMRHRATRLAYGEQILDLARAVPLTVPLKRAKKGT